MSLYTPPTRWREPFSYIKTSETIEETTQDVLSHGFIYLMGKHDNEWLDRTTKRLVAQEHRPRVLFQQPTPQRGLPSAMQSCGKKIGEGSLASFLKVCFLSLLSP